VVARHHIAARGKALSNRANDPVHADLHCLSSWAIERMSAPEMVGLIELSMDQGWWAILTAHGINQGHLPLAETAFTALLAYLARNRDRIWTAPVIEIAQHVASQTAN
jgi:hypothetical protein